MRKSIYSTEQVDFLLEKYRGISTNTLTELFNTEFNLNFNTQQISNFKSGRKLKSGYNRSNWNPMHRPVGAETLIANGYTKVKVAEPNHWVYKHRLMWERVNGPIQDNYLLVFLDNNKQNCNLENLALVDASTHGYMFKNDDYTTDGELTKSAIGISKLMSTIKTMEGDYSND
ncbi:HNH endonuclease signature motif containing protein [Jeotgalibaca porci]|uniref:HNH endonuclease signature motif containing protein n=1 Tax=Jeotgalibaca porci TaxID=1868793 RepID=UPI00359FC751